jgi:hypothetical protein
MNWYDFCLKLLLGENIFYLTKNGKIGINKLIQAASVVRGVYPVRKPRQLWWG